MPSANITVMTPYAGMPQKTFPSVDVSLSSCKLMQYSCFYACFAFHSWPQGLGSIFDAE